MAVALAWGCAPGAASPSSPSSPPPGSPAALDRSAERQRRRPRCRSGRQM